MCYEEDFLDQGYHQTRQKNGYEMHKWWLEKWAFELMGIRTRVKSSIPVTQYAVADAST